MVAENIRNKTNMLSTQAIEEFRKLYKDEFDEVITVSESEILGARLVSLVKAVYGNDLINLKTIDKNNIKEKT